jgi:hypothetical protein
MQDDTSKPSPCCLLVLVLVLVLKDFGLVCLFAANELHLT